MTYLSRLHPLFSIDHNFPIALRPEPTFIALPEHVRALGAAERGEIDFERAYAGYEQDSMRHLFIALSPAGLHSRLQRNSSRDKEFRQVQPFLLQSVRGSFRPFLLRDGPNHVFTVEVIADRETNQPLYANIFPFSKIDVELRYFDGVHAKNGIDESIARNIAGEKYIPPFTSENLAYFSKLTSPGPTRCPLIREAVSTMDTLANIVMGAFMADQSIPGIFTYTNTSGLVISCDPIGDVRAARVSAPVHNNFDRFNQRQVGLFVEKGRPPRNYSVAKEMVHSVLARQKVA